MSKKKKSDNPNVTDPGTILEINIALKFSKQTDLWRDVMDDKEFEKFKKRCNEKGID